MKALLRALALGALGCTEGDARPDGYAPADVPMHHARRTGGTFGEATPATTLLGLFTVPVRINGQAGPPMLVDTGAPLTFVAPGAWAGVAAGAGAVASMEVGAAALYDVPVVGDDPFRLAPAIGGVLGVNLICQFPATWDWQRGRFTLGDPSADVDTVGEPVTVPFRLRGGGTLATANGSVPVPATRIIVDTEVDGVTRHLVLDTGASTTALRDDLVDAMAATRRSVALRVVVQGGVATQRVLRARTLTALGISLPGAPVVGYDRAGLAAVAAETGVAVDGLLGADVLRGHLVTIDYPSGRLVLRRYRDAAHVRDRWVRAGVLLGRAGGAWTVADVLAGTDAARAGVPAGATVAAIDGRALDGLAFDAVDALLQGRAGDTRALRTDRGDFTVRVEDVIPLQ